MGGLSPEPPGDRKTHENTFQQGAESHRVEHGLEELLVPRPDPSSNKAVQQPVCHNCLTDENTGLRDQGGRVTSPKPLSWSVAGLKYQSGPES